MKLFLPLLLPLCAAAALLPPSIGPYNRTSVSQPALTDRPVWAEYGLKEHETAAYEDGKKHFTVTIWRLQDSTGALAVFDWQRPSSAKPSTAAKLAAETKQDLIVVHGNYVTLFEGNKPSGEELSALLGTLNNVDTTSLPTLAAYLPSQDLIANTERFISGPAGLARFDPSIPPSVAGFHFGAEAQLGTFHGPKGDATLAIFNYPTPQIAMQRVTEFEKLPGALAKRSGPLVAVVVGSPDSDFAENLLGKVRYQAEITRDEYVPTRRDNIGDMLYNICVLIGILAGFALVGGLAVGGLRAFRRNKKGEEADAMISLDIGPH